ncbi:hypothetical protein [Micromonospora robiginosa]|uniref:Uncharacterized protein n=1 Tax=Micromonospora robiginosa TaxID=2749844 RepID=A0A7L6B7S5_9ACTN|nr:hypothetical protein [Micromonospora ferruginea]QLQ37954.1 hypothetical protein H1D33_03410 [Micromonospora ferruginea]
MIALAVALILVGFVAAIGWLVWEFVHAPTIPNPDKQVAAAALTPDAPLFTPAAEAAIDDAALKADIELFLNELFPAPRSATPEDS